MATREGKLIRAFVDFSDALTTRYDVSEMMYTLVERCIDILDVSGAGLMLADGEKGLRVMAHSGPRAKFIEILESQTEEGPCFDAYETGQVVVSADLEQDRDRWPNVADVSLMAGYRAAQGIPLRFRDQTIGAMNLFWDEPGTLSPADQDAARAMADIATVTIVNARALSDARLVAEQLQGALNSRVLIEQAKGILAATSGLEMDQAFALIRRHARNHGLKLDAVASRVISGELDGAELGATDTEASPAVDAG